MAFNFFTPQNTAYNKLNLRKAGWNAYIAPMLKEAIIQIV